MMLGFVGGFCYILVMLPEIGGRPVSGDPGIGDIEGHIGGPRTLPVISGVISPISRVK